MSVTYLRNVETGEFERVGPGSAATDTTLTMAGKPADAGAVGAALANYATQAHVSSQIDTKLSKIDEKVDLTKLEKIFSTYYDLQTTVTAGENYTNVSGSATLVGNMLRVRFSADRNSPASGNITNETVVTFSIEHGGKITGGFAVCIGNGTSGHIANMIVSSVSCNATALTFKITLSATGGDTSSVNPFFAIPVLIDISKF